MPASPPDLLPVRPVSSAPVPAALWSRRLIAAAAVAALLTIHWTIGTTALWDKCTTSDEIAHLAAGCAYWKWNDYRLQPENGNLPQRWHAIPAVLSGASLPGPDSPGWQGSDVWQVGRAFFYDQGNDSRKLLAQGRAMAALFSVATCLLVFCWSRRLFGWRGAWLSLLLAALCPTMLAHGPLMTSDMCLTFFLLASTWAVWELLFEITPLRLAGGMLAIGGLFLAKMSAPLIFAVAGVLVVLRMFIRQPLVIRGIGLWPVRELSSAFEQLTAAVAVTILCGLFAFTTVWAAYGFRYWVFAEGPLTDAQFYRLGDMETASRYSGRPGRVLAALAERHVLPEAYLFGSAYVLCHQRRCAFLNGEYSITGWRHYFLYCFAVKTPLALFGILALAAVAISRCRERPPWRSLAGQLPPPPLPLVHLTPLLVLFVIYWATAIQTTLNIGYRHILPTYPVLYILAGAAGLMLTPGRRAVAVALAGLYSLFAAESFAAYPNYIAYFNPLLLRETAYQHLVDSNLDWGQDLPGLARWLKEHNAGPQKQRVYLDYFGNGRPAYEGIEAITLPPPLVIPKSFPYRPGLYCISATRLMAVYADAPGHWNRAYEERYQARRAFLRQCNHAGQGNSPPADEIASARSAFAYGQYLRLLAYLRHRRPNDNVGHSILIFRLTQTDLDQALDGPPAELDAEPWMPQRLKHL